MIKTFLVDVCQSRQKWLKSETKVNSWCVCVRKNISRWVSGALRSPFKGNVNIQVSVFVFHRGIFIISPLLLHLEVLLVKHVMRSVSSDDDDDDDDYPSVSVFWPQWPRKLKMLLWGPLVCPAGVFSLQILFAAGFTAPTGPLFFIIIWGASTSKSLRQMQNYANLMSANKMTTGKTCVLWLN